MRSYLIGGGWTEAARHLVYGPFLQAAGADPTIACVVLDEGDGRRGFERWATLLEAVASCDPTPVLVAEGDTLDVAALGNANGVLRLVIDSREG